MSAPEDLGPFQDWPELISLQADRLGSRPAISDERGVHLTYAELARECERSAAGWAAVGIEPGQHVALLGRNSAEFLVNLIGLARLGAVPVLLNWRLSPTELAALGELIEPTAIAADPDLAESAAAVVRHGLRASLTAPVALLDTSTRQLRTAAQSSALPSGRRRAETFVLLHSSGTTGSPKVIPLTHSAHIWGCRRLAELVGMEPGEVHLRFTPTFHLAGLQEIFTALLTGGHTIVRTGFDAEEWLDDVEHHRAHFAHLPPATMARVVASWDERTIKPDLSSLREVWYGTAPISPKLVRRAREVFGCDLRQVYGMTEAQSPVSMLQPADHDLGGSVLSSAGRPLPEWEVRLVSPDGDDVPTGRPGEVWLRGPELFSGYWTQAGLQSAVDTDGWYHSGDVARRDDEGYLYILDRLKDMIVSGGENVYPAEVEAVLAGHPDVAEVAVVGVPDDDWGESVHAILVPAPGRTQDVDAVLTWARGRLAGFKCPRSAESRAELPRNATGKVLKRELRAPFWADHERGVN